MFLKSSYRIDKLDDYSQLFLQDLKLGIKQYVDNTLGNIVSVQEIALHRDRLGYKMSKLEEKASSKTQKIHPLLLAHFAERYSVVELFCSISPIR